MANNIKPKYIVVGELISHSSIFEITRDDSLTENQVDEFEATRSDYYGVWEYDADSDIYFEIFHFNTAKEAWECYDKLIKD